MKRLLPVFLTVLFYANFFTGSTNVQNTEVNERLQQKLQTMNPVGYVRTLVLLKDKVDIISSINSCINKRQLWILEPAP